MRASTGSARSELVERRQPRWWRLAGVALAAVTAACASTGATPRPFPAPGPRPVAIAPARPAVSVLTRIALDLVGTPYRDGGSDPTGFDCSGFTQYVFHQDGVTLPRETHDQFKVGKKVKRTKVGAGDLLFFSTIAPGPSHVAIALGSGKFVHAPSSRGVVRVERLDASYWSRRFIGARRVTRSGQRGN